MIFFSTGPHNLAHLREQEFLKNGRFGIILYVS